MIQIQKELLIGRVKVYLTEIYVVSLSVQLHGSNRFRSELYTVRNNYGIVLLGNAGRCIE